MPSLTDLLNPTFFMFLGILVLVVALVIVYFESKLRDQNHKIASMLSLVSTLAEDMNGVKMGLNHLAMTRAGGFSFQQPLEQPNIPFNKEENYLIEVSDDESDDASEDNDDDASEDNDDDNDYEESDNESENEIKILKLNINKESSNQDIDETENIDLEEDVSMGELEELEDNLSETNSVSSKSLKLTSQFIEDSLSLHYDNTNKESEEKKEGDTKDLNILASDLKTININLEDSHEESLDYKKLPLTKLRSIVVEKNLVQDASKLKKNDLLKLLGVE